MKNGKFDKLPSSITRRKKFQVVPSATEDHKGANCDQLWVTAFGCFRQKIISIFY